MITRVVSAILAALFVFGPTAARPSATSPTLVVSAASAIGADGRYAVTIEGTFDFLNAVQVGYPLELVVFQGTTFVDFPIAGPVRTGQTSLLPDGRLHMADLSAFGGAGGPAPADVRIVSLAPTSAVVTLPATFTAGTATAQVFTVLPDGSVLSNPLALALP